MKPSRPRPADGDKSRPGPAPRQDERPAPTWAKALLVLTPFLLALLVLLALRIIPG